MIIEMSNWKWYRKLMKGEWYYNRYVINSKVFYKWERIEKFNGGSEGISMKKEKY